MPKLIKGSEGLKVELIAYSQYYLPELKSRQHPPDYIVAEGASISHSADFKTLTDEKAKNLIALLKKLGHESVFEHAQFTFRIEGISRACSHQLVRHRMASYTQQSQRYVSLDPSFIVPASVYESEFREEFESLMNSASELYKKLVEHKIKKEDARFALPQAVETKIVLSMNARELRHFIALRGEKSAQWEIRALAIEILKKAYEVSPWILEDLYEKYVIEK